MNLFIKRIVLFIVLFLSSNFILNSFIKDKLQYGNNEVYATKYSHYLKNESKYNTLFFGSSRTFRHINPQIIDGRLKESQIKSFNLGAPATFNPEALSLYEDFMTNKSAKSKTKYVFIELSELATIAPSNFFTARSYYYIDSENVSFIIKYFWDGNKSIRSKIKNTCSFVQGYFLNKCIPFYPKEDKIDYSVLGENYNGYYPLDVELKKMKTPELIKRNKIFLKDTTVLKKRIPNQKKCLGKGVNKTYEKFLKELVLKSEKHQIKLYFISPPRLKDPISSVNFKDSVVKSRIIDLYSDKIYPDLYISKSSFDIGHLNSYGADLYSRYLSEEISKKINENAGF